MEIKTRKLVSTVAAMPRRMFSDGEEVWFVDGEEIRPALVVGYKNKRYIIELVNSNGDTVIHSVCCSHLFMKSVSPELIEMVMDFGMI
jgi:hypothetical protein